MFKITPEYRVITCIKQRCYNPKNKDYPNYGGRGITVCDRWKGSHQHFITDMGLRPSALHSIDRIDNDGNYEPSNCRWVTIDVQSRNKSDNSMHTLEGRTLCLKDWATEFGINYTTLWHRVVKHGMPIDQAIRFVKFSKEPKVKAGNKRRFCINGKTIGLLDLCEEYGMVYETVTYRLKVGWSIEEALTNPIGTRRDS